MASIKEKLDNYIDKHIIEERLEEVVGDRFAKYSKYIIQDRALPDARDGLKPVQRRVLYGMQRMRLFANSQTKKSARIVGEVMGKYHPHGDSSIYDSLVRMSQDWKMNIPLVSMQGNNGSMDGDSAAAMRYTEAKMTKASELLLENIDKKTVGFVPNFDDTELEPVVLPAKFPNLLVNGSTGISAGYATDIPPHNLKEVIEAVIALIENQELTNEELTKFVLGPDFPTGGIVQGKEGLLQAYETGRGKIMLRAKTEIMEIGKTTHIIVHEIPYEVNKADLVRSIDLIRFEKRIDGILEVRDETDQSGLRIVLDIKKGSNPEFILNYLFKKTNLQTSYNFNMVAILNRKPVLMNLKLMLEAYINHQKEVITNRSNFDLFVAKKRLHIVEGLIRMTSILTEVIETIRASKGKAESKENIINRFGFSEEQAEAIVTLQLYRLSSTDVLALRNESTELEKQIKELEAILSSEKKLLHIIKKELIEVSSLSRPRKTKIEEEIETIRIAEEELITDEQIMIAITKDGYIKRSSIRSYNSSTVCGLKEKDSIVFKEEVSTLNTILIFTSLGNYIYLPAYKIDEQRWKDLGIYINNLVSISSNERIVNAFTIKDFNEDYSILITTKLGSIKQTKLIDFNVSRYSKSLRAMKIVKGDSVVSVDIAKNYPLIVVLTKKGRGLRFKSSDVNLVGTQAGGIRAMNTTNEIACAIYTRNSHDIIILTSRGNIKRIKATDLPLSKRNKAGVEIIKALKTNPHLVNDACTMSYAQYRDNVDIDIATEKANYAIQAFSLKYTSTQAGSPVVPEEVGEPIKLNIQRYDEIDIFDEETASLEVPVDEQTDDFDLHQMSIFDEFEE